MLAICAASVVPLPSGASHLSLKEAPTPDPTGVTTWSSGLLSLKGVPKKPQTTPPFTPGWTEAPAWICAATRLSFASAVCAPVTSMLLTVAVIVMAVSAALKTNRAVPYELGRRAAPLKVGLVGGTSCEFVRLTMKSLGDKLADSSKASINWGRVSDAG